MQEPISGALVVQRQRLVYHGSRTGVRHIAIDFGHAATAAEGAKCLQDYGFAEPASLDGGDGTLLMAQAAIERV